MTPTEAHALAVELVARAMEDDPMLWEDGAWVLSQLDGRGWLVLDQAARTYRHPVMPVNGVRGWLGESLNEPTAFVAALTSLHVDGRFRERATQVLALIDEEIATRALAVRLLDHVPQVRERASAALRERSAPRTLELALDVVLAGKGKFHAAEAISGLRQMIGQDAAQADALVEGLMTSRFRRVRRWAFTLAYERGQLDEATLVHAAVTDTDQWVQTTSAGWLLQTAAPDALRPLLEANSVESRLVALTRVPAAALDQPTLERLLADRAPRVREQARWRARKLGIDFVETYRLFARTDQRPRVRAAALDALALIGDESDRPVIVAALSDPQVRVRAAAVSAVLGRMERPEVLERLIPLLEDPSGRVSSAAARALIKTGVDPSVAKGAWESDRPSNRRAAWRVARSAGDWHRVESDLRAATDADPHLASLGESGIRNWLDVGAATTWSTITDAQKERIAGYLETSQLDAERRRVVAFHAGIRAQRKVGHPTSVEPPAASRARSRWWPFGRHS